MRKTILILASAAILASCDKEQRTVAGGGLQIKVAPTVESEGVKASIQTADLTYFYLEVDCDDSGYSYADKFSKVGTEWHSDKPLLWKDETTPISYSAAVFNNYVFSKSSFENGAELKLPTDQHTQERLNAADLLTLKATGTNYEETTDGTLPVTLSHALTKVNLNFRLISRNPINHNDWTENPMTSLSIDGTNLSFVFQPRSGAISVKTGTVGSVTPCLQEYTTSLDFVDVVYEVILVPQTIDVGQLTINFKVWDLPYKWTNKIGFDLSAGQSTDIPIDVTTI